ncbi:MAG: hypothetical protein B6D46_10040 [Polyangiaceae bacterium UTPRO1]|jgi:hypothetical protein|nr:hypothetical protein [Myxococcales bacterium]OQY66506.1 MAG: hypothetical protein B6D46_10040 [Polyangiaceae bacterium UTPRO1]
MTKILGSVAALALSLAVLTPYPADARPTGVDCTAALGAAKATIDAACPCDTPGNHADHVRCVTQKLRALSACSPDASGKRTCGSVPRACVAKIRRLASRSACGRSAETVTCCIAKQRDCVGDPNPGDGIKAGTCTGSKRKCDRVIDCKVPRCEIAASAERCIAVGGTLGVGRDCSSACGE